MIVEMETTSPMEDDVKVDGSGGRRRSAISQNRWFIPLFAPLLLLGMQIWSPNQIDPVPIVLFASLLVAVATDLRWRKIPNWITYPAALWILIFKGVAELVSSQSGEKSQAIPEQTFVGLSGAIGGFFVCFFIMFMLFRITGGGAGDVKLAAVIGAALGVEGGLLALAYTYIVAAVFSLVWAVWTVGPVAILQSLSQTVGAVLFPIWVEPPEGEKRQILLRTIPLAPFFAIGAALSACKLTGCPIMWE